MGADELGGGKSQYWTKKTLQLDQSKILLLDRICDLALNNINKTPLLSVSVYNREVLTKDVSLKGIQEALLIVLITSDCQ